MEDRRRAQRQPAVWMGSCHVEGEPTDLWRDCGVFDFSTFGVGMDFRYPDAAHLVGRRMSVRLPVGTSVELTFTGEVRNLKSGPDGIVRAGIEFFGLSEDELYVIDLLELGTLNTDRSRAVRTGEDLHVVAGRVLEIEPSAMVVDDVLPGVGGVGPVPQPAIGDPGENHVELLFAHEEREVE